MQLLLFYKMHIDVCLIQNYIGLSKRSYYLYIVFIRFYKQFVIEGAY